MTIIEAIKVVLADQPNGLLCSEIYKRIIERNLYIFRAEKPEAVVNSTIRSHCVDLNFASANVMKCFTIVGYSGSQPRYAVCTESNGKVWVAETTVSTEMLPEEIIQEAYEKHLSSLGDMLMQTIADNDLRYFEQLIVDLLAAIGYVYDKAPEFVGSAADGGINGIIYDNKFGLDQIFLQAIRKKDGYSVGRKELQEFVIAMQNVHKGVFITTSSFTQEALKYAESHQQKNLKLIDRNMLSDLMIRHEVGVIKAAKPLVIYKLDMSYFQ